MSRAEGYNGWSNYETWNAALWIDNDQGAQELWAERAAECLASTGGDREASAVELARCLQEDFSESVPELSGMYADLITAALGAISYYELAHHFIEYAIESDRYPTDEE